MKMCWINLVNRKAELTNIASAQQAFYLLQYQLCFACAIGRACNGNKIFRHTCSKLFLARCK